jgi:hypothetical protein
MGGDDPKKSASVALVFMGTLKVKITGALGDTPAVLSVGLTEKAGAWDMVVNMPLVSSGNASPDGLAPVTCHTIIWLAGQAGAGVQVSVLWSALQLSLAANEPPSGSNASRNWALVWEGSIASLKVNTTAALTATPPSLLAGVLLSRLGWACPENMLASVAAKTLAPLGGGKPPEIHQDLRPSLCLPLCS